MAAGSIPVPCHPTLYTPASGKIVVCCFKIYRIHRLWIHIGGLISYLGLVCLFSTAFQVKALLWLNQEWKSLEKLEQIHEGVCLWQTMGTWLSDGVYICIVTQIPISAQSSLPVWQIKSTHKEKSLLENQITGYDQPKFYLIAAQRFSQVSFWSYSQPLIFCVILTGVEALELMRTSCHFSFRSLLFM